jgi:ribosomal protein S18 acetylase RimI-like enzyme
VQPCYLDRETRAIADLYPDEPGTWVITRINVPEPYRGQGLGSRLLDQILTDADTSGVALLLQPSPSGGLALGPLVQWYRRRGFVWVDYLFMRRDPRGTLQAR